jgi:hypothetical protein
MLRHFRNKHEPVNRIHRTNAYLPPPPSSPIQTYRQSWISIDATATGAAATTAVAAAATAAAVSATNEVENEFRFQHPLTANITGPTGCGKTYFVKTPLQNYRTKMAPPPQRIVWLYKRWQPLYDVIRKTVFPRVEFGRGIPMDLNSDDFFDPRIRNGIVLDDLMSTAAKDPKIALSQNMYFGKDPTQKRNCHYLGLFKNPIDRQPIAMLGRQMYPGRAYDFLQKFEEVTKEPYSYLVVDLKPETPEWRRL